MTTKTAEKPKSERERPTVHSPEEIHAAYECHTLAQMLYGQIAANRPWLLQTPETACGPMVGFGATPWTRAWPGTT